MPYQVMNMPNAYGISNPQLWIIEKRPEVTWMPWFAPGGSMGRARMGQGDMASVYEAQIATLANNARELPNSRELLAMATACYAQAATLRSAVQPADVAARTAEVEKCLSAFRSRVEASLAAPVPAPEPVPAPSRTGVPPAAWALGAAALLGVAAFAVTRR